jgi:hypothetical protein
MMFARKREPGRSIVGWLPIEDWGGWPVLVDMTDPAAYWFHRTIHTRSRDQAERDAFVVDATAFMYTLMLRHGHTKAFWDQLRTVATGPFADAVDHHRRCLSLPRSI